MAITFPAAVQAGQCGAEHPSGQGRCNEAQGHAGPHKATFLIDYDLPCRRPDLSHVQRWCACGDLS